MAMPFAHEDLEKLKNFTDFVKDNPTILNFPQLSFVKQLIENFGGKVPQGEFKMPSGSKCPFGGDKKADSKPTAEPETPKVDEMNMEDSDSESDIELDMEGVIEADTDDDQPMGDSSKTPTEEEIDQAGDLRSKAAAAYSEQNFQEAIDLYTKAIEMNPGNALFHAKRGQAFLKLKKPNACIRDCEKALELNCDSAAGYKFRGRAHRLLGNWEEAAKDLRQACKLDFDEETDEWLREVTPNAKKIEQHRIKQERKKAERLRKSREEANRRAREQQQQQQSSGPGNFSGFSFPGGFPPGFRGAGAGAGGGGTGSGLNMNDLLEGIKDPDVMAALEDITKNPANIDKYKSHPKIGKLIDMLEAMGGDSPGGFPGGFPRGFPGAAGAAPPPASEEPKATPQPKKPDFADDGLD